MTFLINRTFCEVCGKKRGHGPGGVIINHDRCAKIRQQQFKESDMGNRDRPKKEAKKPKKDKAPAK